MNFKTEGEEFREHPMGYTPPKHYTQKELDDCAIADLLNDARCSREQAKNGPFFPEKGITADALISWAETYEKAAKIYVKGGAHKAILAGGIL
jgi:hypothetical protein